MSISERLIVHVDAVTGGAVRDLRALSAESQRLGKVQAATNSTASKGSQLWGQYGGTITRAGVGTLALGVAAFKAGEKYADLGTQVRRFRDIAGVSADVASRWVAVTDDFEISSDAAGRAVQRLARNTKDGGQSLQEFGVEVARSRDGSVDLQGTVENVAEAFRKSHDPAERQRLLLQAFGRQGADLIPILEGGRKGIEGLFAAVPEGQILDNKDLERARDFKLAIDNLKDSFQEIVISFGRAGAGPLTGASNILAGITRVLGGVDDALGTTAVSGAAFGALWGTTIAPGVGTAVGAIAGALSSLIAESDSLTDSISKDWLEALGKAKPGSEEYTRALYYLKEVHSDSVASVTAQQEGEQRLAEEMQTATDKVRALTTALNEQINAQLGVEGALLNVESRTKAYNDAVKEHGAASLEAREAEHSLAEALFKVQPAIQATADRNRDGAISTREQKKSTDEQIFTLSALAGTLAPGSPLRLRIEQYIAQLNGIPKSKTTTIILDATGAFGAIGRIKAALDGLQSKAYLFGGIDGNPATPQAKGGPVSAGSLYLVGEQGPELFVPNSGGRIVPNSALKNSVPLALGAGGSLNVTNIAVEGSVVTLDELADLTAERMLRRERGGRATQVRRR